MTTTCTATVHGTYSAYRRGCRCPQARNDHRLYAKRHREGRAEPRLLDGTGTRRRIQALWALGHASETIAAATETLSAEHLYQISKRAYATRGTRNAIDRAYRALSGVPGGSDRTRERARRAGYAPPAAWDDIDDPTEVPDLGEVDDDLVDEVAVARVLEGDRSIRLTPAEQAHALHVGVASGVPLNTLAAALHLSYGAAKYRARHTTTNTQEVVPA